MNILLLKESNAGEQRVALIPNDIKTLINQSHNVFIENNAGLAAGFSNDDYLAVSATICKSPSSDHEFSELFYNKHIIVRAKRPNHIRERKEALAYQSGTILIGALDPLEPQSDHIHEYKNAGIISYSIDQMDLTTNNPMNILAQMSRIAGSLALEDAISKCTHTIKKVVIIGFGTVGNAAFEHAINKGYITHVVVSNAEKARYVMSHEGSATIIEKTTPLSKQQAKIQSLLTDADIVITSARSPGTAAPLLIPTNTLNHLQPGSVIIDMAIAEGGNVENSRHDKTVILGNNVIVSNTSGYPKIRPHQASISWSRASLLFIQLLLDKKTPPLKSLS